jgi:cytolysin-activating lysine-acyltransferase
MIEPAQIPSANVPRRNSEALGEILWLYAHSPRHQRLRLAEFQQFILPALLHGRYRIYKRGGIPVGYVSIARLSREVEDLLLGGGYRLLPEDWISGDRLWIMQFVVPFGDVLNICRRLRSDPELLGRPVGAFRKNRGRPGVRVVRYGAPDGPARHFSERPANAVPIPD